MQNIQKQFRKPFRGPMLLCILDGVGERQAVHGNAVHAAQTKTLDDLYAICPHATLTTHGEAVGLPEGQMGNSDVGHMTIGSGRVIEQSLERIRTMLSNGEFYQSPAWQETVAKCETSRAIHLVGLLSTGGVHSHLDHAVLLCKELNKLGKEIYIHAITDGRDTSIKASEEELKLFLEQTAELQHVHIADVCGRFFAMDRDERWNRTEKAYNLYTKQAGHHAPSATAAATVAHHDSLSDEMIEPTIVALPDGLDGSIQDNDAVIFFNFRSDRMRQIVKSFTEIQLTSFSRKGRPQLSIVCTMTQYDEKLEDKVTVLAAPHIPLHTIGEVVSKAGGTQLRIAESEKYAHVTYFLNGGIEEPFAGEDRRVIPSPKVKSYDLKPEMSLGEVTKAVCTAIQMKSYDLIVLNIANGDQVGHSGDFQATIKAMQAIDDSLADILTSLKFKAGEMLIIADHGNCEEMKTQGGEACTTHTINPVPIIYHGRPTASVKEGTLADVAPTVLKLMGIKQPEEMTGTPLVSFANE